MEHTKEPWRIEPATKKDNWRTVGANNQVVSIFCGAMDMENARRIVACVNACAGISTEVLEYNAKHGGVLGLEKQRDQLLKALEKYEEAFDSMFAQCCSNPIRNAWGDEVNVGMLNDAHQAAGQAIAAVKGA